MQLVLYEYIIILYSLISIFYHCIVSTSKAGVIPLHKQDRVVA